LILVAACGGGDSGPFPEGARAYSASSDPAVGTERLLIGVSGESGDRLASPDIPVILQVYPEGEPDAAQRIPGSFAWLIPDVSGLYRAWVDLDRPGLWVVEVVPESGTTPGPALVMVSEEPATPGVGDPAPLAESVTLADAPLEEITTDPAPDPRFYQMSVAEAVSSERPSVIVFATPAFCSSGACGPTMEVVRAMAPRYPDVDWVHVEVYTNLDDPGNLQVVPAVEQWGLETEPWVFVVDASGVVAARFEGVVTEEEIAAALGR
jgi:hypothetical protein